MASRSRSANFSLVPAWVLGPAERSEMAELFELTAKYELAFWEMAATGQGWPCMDEEVA